MGHRIAILGVSGYAGGELVRLVDGHPDLQLEYLGGHTAEGRSLADVHPQLSGGDRIIGPIDAARASEADLVFLALPHGASAEPALRLVENDVRVVDLGSDYRLNTPDRYAEAYGEPHPYPAELGTWAYGLPELFGAKVASLPKVAVPGCYPTAALLGLAPLLRAGIIEPPIVVHAVSGASGAGRGSRSELMFGAVSESVAPYGVLTHRHRPEIEQGLAAYAGAEATVLFTPHLAPMQRGILSTGYAPAAPGTTAEAAEACLRAAYAGSRFVHVIDEPPHTRWVVGSNRCLLHVRVDPRTGTVVVISTIDNLLKGAAGQAVQCANLVLGLDETAGLPTEGWMP